MKNLCLYFIIVLSLGFIIVQTAIANDGKVFYNSAEYKKIINNRNNIESVIQERYPEGGFEKEVYDIDKAYKLVESLTNLKKSDLSILDADNVYIFKFKDGSTVDLHFEGYLFNFQGKNYEIVKDKRNNK